MQRTVDGVAGEEAERLGEEVGELLGRHLAGGLRELPMAHLPAAADKSVYRQVEWDVRHDERGAAALHEDVVTRGIKGIAAEETMLAEKPDVAGPRHRRPEFDWGVIRIRAFDLLVAAQEQIDRFDLKPGDIEAEVEVDRGQ